MLIGRSADGLHRYSNLYCPDGVCTSRWHATFPYLGYADDCTLSPSCDVQSPLWHIRILLLKAAHQDHCTVALLPRHERHWCRSYLMKASHGAACRLMESLHDGLQASCVVPVCVHAEHLHRHEDEHGHGCVHQRPVPGISLHAIWI